MRRADERRSAAGWVSAVLRAAAVGFAASPSWDTTTGVVSLVAVLIVFLGLGVWFVTRPAAPTAAPASSTPIADPARSAIGEAKASAPESAPAEPGPAIPTASSTAAPFPKAFGSFTGVEPYQPASVVYHDGARTMSVFFMAGTSEEVGTQIAQNSLTGLETVGQSTCRTSNRTPQGGNTCLTITRGGLLTSTLADLKGQAVTAAEVVNVQEQFLAAWPS